MINSKIPSFQSYSRNEIEELERLSPIFRQYLNLLNQQHVDDQPKEALRTQRLRAWCDCAAATLLKQSSPEVICHYWSDFTDAFLAETWKSSGLDKLPLYLFAMGKLGAQELNLSSDIDLIIVGQNNLDAEIEKKVRHWISSVSQISTQGPGYRVDFDLRPGGRFGPLVTTLSQLEDYYWSRGASWERLALVRLRPIVGDPILRENAQIIFNKFTYRRFLDFRMLEDLKSLRIQIQEHKKSNEASEMNLKLSKGGIRDIELFVNALQVIHGGKDPAFRVHSTSQALDIIQTKKALPEDQCKFLKNTYWTYRGLENYAQSIHDRQSHIWKAEYGAPELVMAKNLSAQVDSIVSDLLGKPTQTEALPQSEADQYKWLESLHYKDEQIRPIWTELVGLTALSTRTQEDEFSRQRVLSRFAKDISSGLDPILGMSNLLEFIRSTRAKAGFFSLLLHEPRIISDLARLFSTSPFLGRILSARPELLDSFVLRSVVDFDSSLESFLIQAYDRRLLTEIALASEFFKSQDMDPICEILTDTADLIVNKLLAIIKENYPHSSLKVLPLGKWASREFGFRSDLDFIFLTQGPPNEQDHKVARRFVSHLTENRKAGSLYAVDMRLRPTGSAGPLMVDESHLLNYFSTTAEAWERQSYLRLPSDFKLRDALHEKIFARGFDNKDLNLLKDIREKLYKNIPNGIDLKYARGGLLDIEFGVQIAVIHLKIRSQKNATTDLIDCLAAENLSWSNAASNLKKTYKKLRVIEQLFQLVTHRSGAEIRSGSEDSLRLGKLLRTPESEYIKELNDLCEANYQVLFGLDPIWLTR